MSYNSEKKILNSSEISSLHNSFDEAREKMEINKALDFASELIEAQYNRIDSLIDRIMDWEAYADEHISIEESYTKDMLHEAQFNVEQLKKKQDNIKNAISDAEKIKPMDWLY